MLFGEIDPRHAFAVHWQTVRDLHSAHTATARVGEGAADSGAGSSRGVSRHSCQVAASYLHRDVRVSFALLGDATPPACLHLGHKYSAPPSNSCQGEGAVPAVSLSHSAARATWNPPPGGASKRVCAGSQVAAGGRTLSTEIHPSEVLLPM